MIYTIGHRTTYHYEKPVGFARCVLRLRPASSDRQTLLSNVVTVTPEPSNVIVGRGPFGEETGTIVIELPHEQLVIEAHSRVDVHARFDHDPDDSPAWEAGGGAAIRARRSFTAARPIVAAASELMTRIYVDFIYDAEATTISTPALQAFEARRGVCQDFAHIMIAGLRGLGLPAAYVSGYLRTSPPPGRPRLAGADATHAWVAIWCGEDRGWIGFDPTNAVLAQNDHIVLARGRDYSDVAPIDGIILAPGGQTLKVAVDVVPDGEALDSAGKCRQSTVHQSAR
jgi:transglutaminase-like putative cysteine protease